MALVGALLIVGAVAYVAATEPPGSPRRIDGYAADGTRAWYGIVEPSGRVTIYDARTSRRLAAGPHLLDLRAPSGARVRVDELVRGEAARKGR